MCFRNIHSFHNLTVTKDQQVCIREKIVIGELHLFLAFMDKRRSDYRIQEIPHLSKSKFSITSAEVRNRRNMLISWKKNIKLQNHEFPELRTRKVSDSPAKYQVSHTLNIFCVASARFL